MRDYFLCKKLSHSNNDFCSLYGHWDAINKGKCNECSNNNICEMCANKNIMFLNNGELSQCCGDCNFNMIK